MKKMILLTLSLIALPVMADNCDKPRDDFDGLYCLNKVYQESDKELNESYKALRDYLTDEQKAVLKKTQVAWINTRNDECSFRRNGTFFVSLSCTTALTIERTNQLRDRIRECKATGCQAGKL